MTIKPYTVIGIDYDEDGTFTMHVEATSPEDAVDKATMKYEDDNGLSRGYLEDCGDVTHVYEGHLTNVHPGGKVSR